MLLTLGIGTAWAAEYTIKATDGFKSSYSDDEATFEKEDVTYGYLAAMYNANNTPTAWYKQQLIQCRKHTASKPGGDVWNVTPLNISKVIVKLATSDKDFTLYYGSTVKPTSNSIAKSSLSATEETITYSGYVNKAEAPGKSLVVKVYTFDLQGTDASYFLLDNGTSANYIWEIIIQTTDGGETPDPETPAATLTADPTSLDFGTVTQNEVVAAKEFTISGSDFTDGNLTLTAPSGYTVFPTTVAVDGTLASTTVTVTPNTTAVGPFNGNLTIIGGGLASAVNVALSMTVNKAPATPTENVYVKVTNAVTDGEYLIVYEDAGSTPSVPVIFDGSLATLDATGNMKSVSISGNVINGDTEIDAATFTISTMTGGFAIKSKSGKYIGRTSGSNGMNTNASSEILNKITISDGKITIAGSGDGSSTSLQYYATSGSERFRYYSSTQKAIALYKKASSHTLTYGTCTNGSVSADVADGATVLSGTTITLDNEPVAGYKLSAYDVYKTGDETTKVTVTDGKFVMPEYDVTISATFEAAKTLTSIEITTPATQKTFWQGETFNYTGLEVTAHFDGADDEVVTPTVTGSTATAGTQTVTVSFTEGSVTKSTSYEITVKATANTEATAYDVATAREIIDKVSTANDIYVAGIVSEIVTAYNPTYGNITYNISADGLTTSAQLQAYRGKGVNGENFSSADDIQIGDEVVVKGNLKKHNTIYEFDADNQLVKLTREKQQAGLVYATTEYTANVGETFATPELTNPNGLTVEYSTSDATLATVDAATGAVTRGDKVGTVTITATFAGNASYVQGSASYTIKISDPSLSEVTFVAGTDVSDEKSISKNGVTVEFTDGVFNRADNYRCYSGKEMTISYADGQITKIVFECTVSGDAKYGPGKFTTESGYTYAEKVGTWVGDAKSVTFAASDQVRMTSITVYYKQDTRTPAGIAWSSETINLTVGDEFTAPTFTNPNDLSGITFASSNEELATVNNAGEITLVSGKTGTATITATFADGHADYKPAEATCVITVSPKSEKVVILAQYNGQWYALKAAYLSGETDRLDAIPVNYVGGKLYNVAEADKASIEWSSVVEGDKVSFLNDGKYLKGKTSTTLLFEEDADGLYQWDNTTYTMTIGTTVRSFLYNGEAFRNFAVSNAGKVVNDVLFSSLPVVTAPVYGTGTITQLDNLTPQMYGTICLENNVVGYEGITFYEVAGKESNKVIFDEVTELEAGMPYI